MKVALIVDEFSVEHKIPWLDSDDPIGLFFSLDNIAFSHHSCNSGAGGRRGYVVCPSGQSWCYKCKKFKSTEEFWSSSQGRPNGLNPGCKECLASLNKEYKLKRKQNTRI